MIKNNILKGEVFFALFLVAGAFKEGFTLPKYVPDLTLLFMSLSMLVVVKRLLKSPYITKNVIQSLLFFLPLPLLMAFSLFYTDSTIYAFEKLSRFLIITSWAYIGGILLLKNKKSLKLFLNTLLFVSVMMGIQSLFIYADNRTGFVSVFGSNYLALGRMCAIGIFIAVTLYVMDKTNSFKQKALFFIIACLLMFSLLLTGSRMPLLSLILTLFMIMPLYFLRIKQGNIFVKKSIVTFVSEIMVGIFLIIYGAISGLFSTTVNRFLMLTTGGGDSALSRIERYGTALKMWSENFILGGGVGSFSVFYTGVDKSDYAHNIFLEIGSEMGIVGIFSFIFILLFSLYKISRTMKHKDISKNLVYCILLITFYLFLNANVSGDLNDNRMLFTFLGITMISSQYIEKKEFP